jgi:hypothetical protein
MQPSKHRQDCGAVWEKLEFTMDNSRRDEKVCARCGRSHSEAEGPICAECKREMLSGGRGPEAGGQSTVKLHLSPIVREALAAVAPGEDFDEALLRVLKARHPEQAMSLLSALNRVIELEAQRTREDKRQTLKRLAEQDPGPEVVLKTTIGGPPKMPGGGRVIQTGDKVYHSLEELPSHLRRAVEKTRAGKASAARPGCAWMLLGGWLLALLRGPRG